MGDELCLGHTTESKFFFFSNKACPDTEQRDQWLGPGKTQTSQLCWTRAGRSAAARTLLQPTSGCAATGAAGPRGQVLTHQALSGRAAPPAWAAQPREPPGPVPCCRGTRPLHRPVGLALPFSERLGLAQRAEAGASRAPCTPRAPGTRRHTDTDTRTQPCPQLQAAGLGALCPSAAGPRGAGPQRRCPETSAAPGERACGRFCRIRIRASENGVSLKLGLNRTARGTLLPGSVGCLRHGLWLGSPLFPPLTHQPLYNERLNLDHYSTPLSSGSCQYWMSNTKQRYSSTNVQIFKNIK